MHDVIMMAMISHDGPRCGAELMAAHRVGGGGIAATWESMVLARWWWSQISGGLSSTGITRFRRILCMMLSRKNTLARTDEHSQSCKNPMHQANANQANRRMAGWTAEAYQVLPTVVHTTRVSPQVHLCTRRSSLSGEGSEREHNPCVGWGLGGRGGLTFGRCSRSPVAKHAASAGQSR